MLRVVDEASLTDVGRQRSTNEDAYLSRDPLFAVADGMGGAQAGEVAARMAVQELRRTKPDASAGAETQLRTVASEANRRIYELAQQDRSRAGMGTTLSAVMVAGEEVSIGHVGDSRVYRLRDGELERLTDDHSLVEEFVRQGKLSPEEAEDHPQKSIITRALGPEPEVKVDTFTYPARSGDVYLLCSDGLTGMVSEDGVAELLRDAGTLGEAADRLVEAANLAGGRDNVTVVLFRLGEEGEGPGDQEPAEVAVDQTLTGRELEPLTAEQVQATAAERRAAAAATPRAAADTATPPEHLVMPERRRGGALPQPLAPASRGRAMAGAAVVTLIVAAIVVGLYVASRQVYFVGTDRHGLVTLYRGLPYDLPLGIELYEREYSSSVPAEAVRRIGRADVIDHELRSRGDATDLIRQVELGTLFPAAPATPSRPSSERRRR